jgi:hypothetical protein
MRITHYGMVIVALCAACGGGVTALQSPTGGKADDSSAKPAVQDLNTGFCSYTLDPKLDPTFTIRFSDAAALDSTKGTRTNLTMSDNKGAPILESGADVFDNGEVLFIKINATQFSLQTPNPFPALGDKTPQLDTELSLSAKCSTAVPGSTTLSDYQCENHPNAGDPGMAFRFVSMPSGEIDAVMYAGSPPTAAEVFRLPVSAMVQHLKTFAGPQTRIDAKGVSSAFEAYLSVDQPQFSNIRLKMACFSR